jgi:sigma-B regulation protein RsbU (phosphoserine phosphatase)
MITNDLEQAQRFQELILPVPPKSERIHFGVFYRPAELVGGDVYDIYERRPGEFRVFLADATGHGVQAALRTMLLKAEYDRLKDAHTPEQTLITLNANVTANYPGLEMQCSASCFDVVLGASGKARVRYATAAHPPLLVFNGSSTATPVYKAGPFLGVVPAITLEPVELDIEAGTRLLIYSDGLEEQWSTSNQEFGLGRVEAAIGDRSVDLWGAVERLIAEWTLFLGSNRPDDDATLIAVECVG